MPEQDENYRLLREESAIKNGYVSDRMRETHPPNFPGRTDFDIGFDAGWNARSEENAELKEEWDGAIDQRADYFSRLCRLAEAKGEFDHMGDTGDTAKWHRLEHLLESGIYYERMVSRTSE